MQCQKDDTPTCRRRTKEHSARHAEKYSDSVSVGGVRFSWCDCNMNESTTPDIAAAVAALLAAVGQNQTPAPAAPVTMLTVKEAAEYLSLNPPMEW